MAKQSKRDLILLALESLLPGKRFHEITLDEVSRVAQVGKGTIYLYFRDKDALFSEMVCFRLEQLQHELEELLESTQDDLPKLLMESIISFINQHRAGFGQDGEFAAQVAKMSPEELEKVKSIARNIIDVVAALMKKSCSSWSDAQARNYAHIFLWMIDGYARSQMGGAMDLPEPELLLEFFRNGSGITQHN